MAMLLDETPSGMFLPRFELAANDAFWKFTSFTIAAYALEDLDSRNGAVIAAADNKSNNPELDELLEKAGDLRIARAIVSTRRPSEIYPEDIMLSPTRLKMGILQLTLTHWLLDKV